MKELKNVIERELKEGFKTIEEYYKNSEDYKELQHKIYNYMYDKREEWKNNNTLYLKLKEEQKAEQLKADKLKEKIEIEKNIIAIIRNNLKLQVIEILQNEIFKDLKKYSNKNIGEKTKEKIENFISEYLEKNYNLIASVRLSLKDYYFSCDILSIEIYKSYEIKRGYQDNEYKQYSTRLNVDNDSRTTLIDANIYTLTEAEAQETSAEVLENYKKYNDKYYLNCFYANNLKFIELNNIKTEAKRIYKEWIKTVKEIKALKNKIDILKNNFNENNTNCALNFNYIELDKIR